MKESDQKNNTPKKSFLYYYGLVMLIVMLMNIFVFPAMMDRTQQVRYDQFEEQLDNKNVNEVYVTADNEIIYIMTGSIPNAKSQPLVDEWFGLLYRDGKFDKALSMREVLSVTGLGATNIPNTGDISAAAVEAATKLLNDVVNHAKEYLHGFYTDYQKRINPLIDEEIDKLGTLEEKHKDYQLSLFESERKKTEAERRVDELFESFTDWVTDTLEIKDNPYIRVIAVAMGGK